MRTLPVRLMEEGVPYRVEVDGLALVIVRVGERAFALDDMCSHQRVPLSDGLVDPTTLAIECPRHGSEFALGTGDVLSLPATKPVKTYQSRSSAGFVEVELPG